MPDLVEARLVDALTTAQRVLWRDLSERFADEGVTVEQWRVLRALALADGASMTELADVVQVPAPTLTRLVDALVDQAWAYRRPSGSDRRRIEAHLSDSGRDVLGRLEAIADAHERAVREGLGGPALALVRALSEMAPVTP